ncbi:MAG: Carboxynorspermidine decarboxylase, putative (EC [uncultured Sulfurovum sp.]|uniref:Carboxynorspermidine/carboxyspermidine decarboxylase n=1 Tax=uncultured Sulfurovum sp. TaxID=269237 RepID=A0A6S6S4A6_9BACT|nr:MAG: Carboxynorspermidine decarboxylase, putative (EC [uncultured Sulfurovum sp.]
MKDGRNGMQSRYPSPCFVMEKKKLDKNLKIFSILKEKTNITWLYTLKCFHESEGLAHISHVSSGFSIGNLNELSLAKKHQYTHIHSYAPAFYEEEVTLLADASDTMSFNSLRQWIKYSKQCQAKTSLGIRINPQLSLSQPSYCDTSHKKSRLGMSYMHFISEYNKDSQTFEYLEGLHFHAFCHQEVSALTILLTHIMKYYTHILPKLKWINLGGGQNFTHTSYDIEVFIACINHFHHQYPHIRLYFEPGSSIVHNTGYFTCTILDIIEDNPSKVILDTSIESHLLDVAITKQSLNVKGISKTKTPYVYELTGMSCIAGDIIGIYYFDKPLDIGENIIFENMMGYTLVKQNTFNGINKANFVLI